MDNRSLGRLKLLLELVANTAGTRDPRNIERYINPMARRIMKACDEIEGLTASRAIPASYVPRLVEVAGTGNNHVAGSIQVAIGYIGATAVSILIDMPGDPTAERGSIAAGALGHIGVPAVSDQGMVLATLLTRGMDRSVTQACTALAHMGISGLPVLSRLLDFPSMEVGRLVDLTRFRGQLDMRRPA